MRQAWIRAKTEATLAYNRTYAYLGSGVRQNSASSMVFSIVNLGLFLLTGSPMALVFGLMLCPPVQAGLMKCVSGVYAMGVGTWSLAKSAANGVVSFWNDTVVPGAKSLWQGTKNLFTRRSGNSTQNAYQPVPTAAPAVKQQLRQDASAADTAQDQTAQRRALMTAAIEKRQREAAEGDEVAPSAPVVDKTI